MEGNPDIWHRYTSIKYLSVTVDRIASFVRADPNDTFLMQNATKALNTVIKSFPLRSGDAVLATSLSYSSVVKPAQQVTSMLHGCKTYYLNLSFPIKSEDSVVEQYAMFLEKHPDVRLAVIDHITSPTSVIMPVKRLISVCHSHSVIVLVDGAHAPGQLPIDLVDMDPDFYTGNLHKWLFTPRGCAFLWMNPKRKHSWLRPLITAKDYGLGLRKEFLYEGTIDTTPYLCAMDGIDFFNRLGGLDKIYAHTCELRSKVVSYLEKVWGTERLDIPASMVAPNMQMIQLPFIRGFSDHPNRFRELQQMLDETHGVQAYTYPLEGKLYTRISVHVYNTFEDYTKLAEVILRLSREE